MLKSRSSTCISSANKAFGGIFHALPVDILVTHVLAAETTHELVLLKLASIPIDQASPLVHLMPGLLIEFILIIVILFLELLAELPDYIILELQ